MKEIKFTKFLIFAFLGCVILKFIEWAIQLQTYTTNAVVFINVNTFIMAFIVSSIFAVYYRKSWVLAFIPAIYYVAKEVFNHTLYPLIYLGVEPSQLFAEFRIMNGFEIFIIDLFIGVVLGIAVGLVMMFLCCSKFVEKLTK